MKENEDVWFHITTPLDTAEPKFYLENVEGEEQISGLFFYRAVLHTRDEAVDFSKLLGEPVAVHMECMDGESTRFINGIVSRLVQGNNDGKVITYYAELRPWLWQLTLSEDCRIFQNKKTTEIIAEVFGELGFSDFKDKTSGSYTPREYCVQYGESDFNFVSRLMEEDGIFYFFEHTAGKHTLILADNNSTCEPCKGFESVRLRDVDPEEDDLCQSCTFEQELVSNKYAAKDYNFETPAANVFSKVDGKESGKLEVYEYPGGFLKTGAGEKIVNRRIEEREVPGKKFKGETYCRGFAAGHKFTFADHYRGDYNDDYIIEKLFINARDEQYLNSFEAFPASVSFRPPRISRRPKIYGTQTATVVGKSGEEIWTDKYGRIMVQFHWDLDGKKDEKSSCWVRVAQVWAGKSWGTFFIPRVGAEVVVSFLEGNPDKPLVTGTLYNASQTVPYSQPGEKTKSTIKTNSSKGGGGFNELRFEDKKDAEEIYLHAQKDMNVEVLNDQTVTITKNRTTTIEEEHEKLTVAKGNRTITISKGNESLTVSKGNRTVKVDKGNETHSVKGKRNVTVTKKETHANKDNFVQTVKKNFTLKVDGNLTLDVKGNITIKAGKNMTLKAGQSISSKAGQNITGKAGLNFENKGVNVTNKASANLKNEAGAMMTNKASAMQKVDGGGMLMLKGGVVKIN